MSSITQSVSQSVSQSLTHSLTDSLRESIALPIIFVQITLVFVSIQNGDDGDDDDDDDDGGGGGKEKRRKVGGSGIRCSSRWGDWVSISIGLTTFISLLSWQFTSFVLLVQSVALIGSNLLGTLNESTMRRIQCSIVVGGRLTHSLTYWPTHSLTHSLRYLHIRFILIRK